MYILNHDKSLKWVFNFYVKPVFKYTFRTVKLNNLDRRAKKMNTNIQICPCVTNDRYYRSVKKLQIGISMSVDYSTMVQTALVQKTEGKTSHCAFRCFHQI